MTPNEVTSADGGWRVLFTFGAQWPAGAEFLRLADGVGLGSINKFTRSFKAGIQGYQAGVETIKPARYQGGGRSIHCLQCEGDVSQEQETGVLGLGTILICDSCGLSQLYGKKPERLPA